MATSEATIILDDTNSQASILRKFEVIRWGTLSENIKL
jgi:hypothetical protein